LNILQLFVSWTFNFRNFSQDGLVERLRLAKFDGMVLNKFFSDRYDAKSYTREVKELIRQSNDSALETLALTTGFARRHTEEEIYKCWSVLENLSQEEMEVEERITSALDWLESCYR
jgi:anaerobic magnesium-protoporphyrin IX monomethyl ester cyclase